jgi:hypothetical protein
MFVALKERGFLTAGKQFGRFNTIQYKISARKDEK